LFQKFVTGPLVTLGLLGLPEGALFLTEPLMNNPEQMADEFSKQIARLNDQFRTTFFG